MGQVQAANRCSHLKREARYRGSAPRRAYRLAEGEPVIKCPSPLKALKYAYDHSCYCACSDEYQHLMTDSPRANIALLDESGGARRRLRPVARAACHPGVTRDGGVVEDAAEAEARDPVHGGSAVRVLQRRHLRRLAVRLLHCPGRKPSFWAPMIQKRHTKPLYCGNSEGT